MCSAVEGDGPAAIMTVRNKLLRKIGHKMTLARLQQFRIQRLDRCQVLSRRVDLLLPVSHTGMHKLYFALGRTRCRTVIWHNDKHIKQTAFCNMVSFNFHNKTWKSKSVIICAGAIFHSNSPVTSQAHPVVSIPSTNTIHVTNYHHHRRYFIYIVSPERVSLYSCQ